MQSEVVPNVLVVEDEPDVRELIGIHVRRLGFPVTLVASVEEARGAIKANRFDLVVLDWMLPGTHGVVFAKELKELKTSGEIGILMVTAKSEPQDIVEGLEAGADDYLTKPFEPSVLGARLRALSRRVQLLKSKLNSGDAPNPDRNGLSTYTIAGRGSSSGSEGLLRLGHLSLNTETYEAKCGLEALSLTPSEFKLMVALAKSRGRVLTRDSLIAQVQGEGVSVVGRTVDTHVFGLRKKLGRCSEVIETVRGVGYRVRVDET